MSPIEFLAAHRAALERHEVRHSVVLSVMDTMRDEPLRDISYWSLGEPGECAIMGVNRPILLSDLVSSQCKDLARLTRELNYPGVVGPDDTAHWFAEAATRQGICFGEPILERIHQLIEPPKFPGVPGYARTATADDADLMAQWTLEFAREATPYEIAPSRQRRLKFAGQGWLVLWIVKGRPVSMAAIVRRTRHTGGIAFVYTPPRHRGKGYAGSVTATVAAQIFAEGKSIATLYTDLANPYSNRCYAKIGFKPVCDAVFYPTNKSERRDAA
jgi:RimJ/RimL family protein N-acetyltransferase